MAPSVACIVGWGSVVVQQSNKGLQIPQVAKWCISVSSQLCCVLLSGTKVLAAGSGIHLYFDWRFYFVVETYQFSLCAIPGFMNFHFLRQS